MFGVRFVRTRNVLSALPPSKTDSTTKLTTEQKVQAVLEFLPGLELHELLKTHLNSCSECQGSLKKPPVPNMHNSMIRPSHCGIYFDIIGAWARYEAKVNDITPASTRIRSSVDPKYRVDWATGEPIADREASGIAINRSSVPASGERAGTDDEDSGCC